MNIFDIKGRLPTLAVLLSVVLLAACGSASSDGSGNDGFFGNDGSSNAGGGNTGDSSKACAGGQTCGALDVVQETVADLVGGQIGGALPEPLGSVAGCASDVVNNVVDVPDALLVGLEDLASTQDPAALMTAFDDIGASLNNAVYNLQALLTGLAGQGGAGCDEAGSGESPDNGGDGGSAGPTGTPLDAALAPLMDGLDTLVSTLQDSAAGTPAAALVDPIVEGLDALLAVLEGGGSGGVPALPGLPGGGDNPLTGLLTQLQDQLAGLPGGGGDGGDSSDQDLEPLTDILDTVVTSLGAAIGNGQAQLEDAAGSEVPVVSGLLLTLSTLLQDTGDLVDEVGEYDGVNANAAIETLLENTLGNALTELVPLRFIGEQAGQDLAGPVRDGIAQGVSAIGDGTELLIDPLLSTVLDDAASPLLDPIEGAIATLLASSPVDLGDVLGGGIDQLVGALGMLTSQIPGGDGGGNPLDTLLGGLPDGGSGGSGPTGTPADLLLGALIDNDPTGVLGGLLGTLTDGLLGLLGGLAP